MGEDFIPGFKETFSVIVKGKDIPECRFNAWTALEQAIGILPRHHWKLVFLQHGITEAEDEDGKAFMTCACQAQWVFDPDSDGGKNAELLTVDPNEPDTERVS